MKWRKHGLLYAPTGAQPWARAYAFPPTPFLRPSGELRLYVAFCDEATVGRLGYVDVDPTDPSRILGVAERPLLDVGEPGAFDENGLLPTSIVAVGDELYLYYVGYQLGHRVRYFQFQGLAISRDGGESFERARRVPVLERSDGELCHRTSAFVRRENGRFRMWYVGGSRWTEVNGKSLPVYDLKHVESSDGIAWPSSGKQVLGFADPDEHAFGRPWVTPIRSGYRMFYSVRTRSKGYRIGYAESPDGLAWERRDAEVGIDVSPSGWDSEMIAYASVVAAGKRTFLFYNGNGCGRTGFGWAELEGPWDP